MTTRCVSDYRRGDEFLPGSPSFEPDSEYEERMEAITDARDALNAAEFGRWMKAIDCTEPWAEWNDRIYASAELMAGRMSRDGAS